MGLRDSIFDGQRILRYAASAVPCYQFGGAHPVDGMKRTTLAGRIAHVVAASSGEQMTGIAARRIVAGVARMKFTQRAVRQFVCGAMCAGPPFRAAIHSVPHNASVSPAVEHTAPRPAFVWPASFNVFPEAVCKWYAGRWHGLEHTRIVVTP